eukprot:179537-Heterocapsa_arctica.AAC.1
MSLLSLCGMFVLLLRTGVFRLSYSVRANCPPFVVFTAPVESAISSFMSPVQPPASIISGVFVQLL